MQTFLALVLGIGFYAFCIAWLLFYRRRLYAWLIQRSTLVLGGTPGQSPPLAMRFLSALLLPIVFFVMVLFVPMFSVLMLILEIYRRATVF